MEHITQFIDIILHLDVHLQEWVNLYGLWIYVILFAIIFGETGFVVLPFLPGDSLLFVAGAIAAVGGMNIFLLVALLIAAAVLGNTVNFTIGRYLGAGIERRGGFLFLDREALQKTHAFYEENGGKAIVISRFLPLFRSFVPFVAGMADMTYARFTMFNIGGALLWVISLCMAGYFFGNIEFIKSNLSAVIIAIIVLSLLPAIIGWVQHKRAKRA